MQKNLRNVLLIAIDILLIHAALIGSQIIRFEGTPDPQYFRVYLQHAIALTVIKLVVFQLFKLYKSVWRFAGIDELVRVAAAAVVANTAILSYLFLMEARLPRSIFIICTMLDMMMIGGVRLGYRMVNRLKSVKPERLLKAGFNNVMIIGAGDAGALVIKELRQHDNLMSKPVALIDDNPMKKGQILYHVPVVGGRERIVEQAEALHIAEIIIAIPSAPQSTIREIVKICEQTQAKLKIVPGVYEMLGKPFDYKSIRDVQIEDLLGRDEVKLDMSGINDYLRDKTVMITGGGGSIGSELARQVAAFSPKELILLDIYENNLYELQHELLRKYPEGPFKLTAVIASVRDEANIDRIVGRLKPEVIFHAAAHKHVPLMEDNPKEAVKNNIFGTYNMAKAADRHGVKRFVMISTDKAVNPTNVMGATKRVCEMIIQSFDAKSQTEFVGVRFGNVLGSNGSVIPLFKRQIKEVGYVTVTHPDIIRYFMTIPEAAKLVLQAGAMAQGGELFVLDMGEPVKIVDLAKDLIRLSGFTPDEIPIKFVGLRPGEKLYEELLMDEEGIKSTTHEKIFVGKPLDIESEVLNSHLEQLKSAAGGDLPDTEIVTLLKWVVPTFKTDKELAQ